MSRQSVLITGCSTGLGLVTAVELAKRGWRVFATMRDPSKSFELRRALTEARVSELVHILELDVVRPASIRTALAAVLRESGGTLDALVHNAGISVAGAFEDIPDGELRRVMETNFFGVLELTRQALPAMRAQRRGRILVVSSEAAFFGLPANSIYSASKWAIEGWAESLVYEVAPFGIDVILVEPGPYRTPIWDKTLRIRPQGSPYRALVQQLFRRGDEHAAAAARDPAEVAIAISRLLAARRPRFRTAVGPIARLNHLLRGKIPSRLFRALISRYLGLNRIKI